MELEQQLVRLELVQRREEGCDVSELEPLVESAMKDGDGARCIELYNALMALSPTADFPFEEPSELDAIHSLRPEGPRRMAGDLDEKAFSDRVLGAWLGRASGCSLGKPVEGWPRDKIDNYLESNQALPLNDYIPYVEGAMSPTLKTSTRGNIEFMARDDDMDYPILGLLVLEHKGAAFRPRHMADIWLGYMPFHTLYTAENVAYRNFVNRRWPPESAEWRNPYREWIGAQIRADIFGYVAPGWPERAAELAYRDACISHAKNGIYGEMFVAAMLAAAFVTEDIDQIVETGLSEIPAQCRLAEAVRDTLSWCNEHPDDWEAVWDRIDAKYGHYHGVHTINNAAFVVLGLKFGAEDFGQGIALSVRCGSDTDCNGATVGSILGARIGAARLPQKWIGVLGDRLVSTVRDNNDNSIKALAERTCAVAREVSAYVEEKEPQPGTGADVAVTMSGNLPGVWLASQTYGDNLITINPDLSGQFEMVELEVVEKLRDVKVDGHRVSFSYTMPKGGAHEIEVDFEGTIDGDTLEGMCMTGGFEFPLVATRTG